MRATLPQVFRFAAAAACASVGLTAAGGAKDGHPVVGPGATKEEVIAAYGWPNGQSQSGAKEILSYSQGEVILENGRVERVNFSPNVPWQTPRPKPPPPTASTRKVPEAPVDFWLTAFDAALQEAQRRNARVLALFTGSDWSPASRQFHDDVEFHPDFVNAFAGDFVFVKFDYPRGNPVPVRISEENLALRDRYQVTTYPTLLVLSPAGDLLARVDLTKADPALSFRDRVIGAVRAARDAGLTNAAQPPASVAKPAGPVSHPPSSATAAGRGTLEESPASSIMFTAGGLILAALGLGVAISAFVFWRMWRRGRQSPDGPPLEIADRIDAAAGGMPTVAEMNGWSKKKLCAITAALAEFDGYTIRVRPESDEIDLELRKQGDVKPRTLVCCSPGMAGAVSTKRLRELFASLAAEGVDNGWFVCPGGFSADARDYAAAHRIVLVTSDGLHGMMREVPPVSLPAILARE